MTEDEEKFLREVRFRCQDPTMLRNVINVAITGCEDNAFKLQCKAADMEVVASMAMNTRLFKGNEDFLAQKLEKWQGQTSLRWDDQINKLKEKK